MGKTNGTSKLDHGTFVDRDRLADSELNAASGGVRFNTSLVTVEGHTQATWTPRSYAVQTDLSGGVTGAHASLYEWKRP